METNMQTLTGAAFISADALLNHWQGHRRLTRKVIAAFPEDKLFSYSIGGMRPFADLAKEMMGLASTGIRGILTNDWTFAPELDYHAGTSTPTTKEGLLSTWDKVTDEIDIFWPQISAERFREVVMAFGQYQNEVYNTILYLVDNEIHHRGQGYVYLRSLGVEPPAFWDRF